MSALDLLRDPVWQRLALALLHFVWQGALIALVLGGLMSVLRVRRPQVRYAVWLGGLALMAVCPAVTFVVAEPSIPMAASLDVAAGETAAQPWSAAAGGLPASQSPSVPTNGFREQVAWAVERQDLLVALIAPYLVLFWFAGVGIFGGRLLLGFAGVHWLALGRRPPGAALAEQAALLAQRIGLRGGPRVAICARSREALAVGFLRPLILLPAAWLTELPPEVLRAVLAHELAHIRRRDVWVNLLQRVVETLLFYHPAVWWISRRVRAERELSCDDLAVKATGGRVEYAQALECVAQRRLAESSPLLAAGIGARKMALLKRVQHVLGTEPRGASRAGRWSAGLIALAIPPALWLVVSVLAPPVVGQEERERDVREFQPAESPELRERETMPLPDTSRLPAELLERFKRAFEQGRYAEAEAIVSAAKEHVPENPALTMMFWKARLARRMHADVERARRDAQEQAREAETRAEEARRRAEEVVRREEARRRAEEMMGRLMEHRRPTGEPSEDDARERSTDSARAEEFREMMERRMRFRTEGFGPDGPPLPGLVDEIRRLREEVEQLRREVEELRQGPRRGPFGGEAGRPGMMMRQMRDTRDPFGSRPPSPPGPPDRPRFQRDRDRERDEEQDRDRERRDEDAPAAFRRPRPDRPLPPRGSPEAPRVRTEREERRDEDQREEARDPAGEEAREEEKPGQSREAEAETLEAQDADLAIVTYPVGDLVVTRDGEPDFGPLKQRIEQTFFLGTGLLGRVMHYDATRSLVIRTTPFGHAGIQEMLTSIRRRSAEQRKSVEEFPPPLVPAQEPSGEKD